ncbi:MAG: hypothetical protein M4579_005001 [Chaenotheca gracillima]|nr:MAG: hypothetical protein M4579_005001 [Chaenotheca gracillima]
MLRPRTTPRAALALARPAVLHQLTSTALVVLTTTQSRSFWWSHYQPSSSKQHSSPSSSCYQRHIPKRRVISFRNSNGSAHKPRIFDRSGGLGGTSWSWCRGRLSSSWGGRGRDRDGYGPLWNSRSARERDSERMESKEEMLARRMQEIRRQIEHDPFGALFGRRLARASEGAWFPSRLFATWGWKGFKGREFGESMREAELADRESGRPMKETSGGDKRTAQVKKEGDVIWKSPSVVQKESEMQETNMHDEFEFDPITMRRIPRTITRQDDVFDIPVKKFQEKHPASATPTPEPLGAKASNSSASAIAPAMSQDRPSDPVAKVLESTNPEAPLHTGNEWLSREGFVTTPQAFDEYEMPGDRPKASPQHESRKTNDIRTASSSTSKLGSQAPVYKRSGLTYDTSETKEEDLDLLRSNDIRAGSAISKKPSKESASEKQKTRNILNEEFNLADRQSKETADIIAAQKTLRERAFARASLANLRARRTAGFLGSKGTMRGSELENAVQELENAFVAEEQERENGRSKELPQVEPITSHATRLSKSGKSTLGDIPLKGEGDVSDDIGKYADRSPLSSRRMLEHNVRNAEQRSDSQLVKEIRSIYEKEYGTIDSGHRQPDATLKQAPLNTEGTLRRGNELRGSNRTERRSRQISEENALRMEEKEQILFEEIKEIDDEIYGFEAQVRDAEKVLMPRASEKAAASTVQKKESATSPLSTYKILAYDPVTQEVNTATTSSSIAPSNSSPSEHTISPPEIVSRLSHPAKFLPYFSSLEADGFEIISGTGDVLVFKKVRDPVKSSAPATEEPSLASPSFSSINPIDGTTTGNFASPTGFVNHDSVFPEAQQQQQKQKPESAAPVPQSDPVESVESTPSPPRNHSSTLSSGDKVRREEPVFSGGQRWIAEEDAEVYAHRSRRGGRAKRTIKRVFWVGAWVAGCTYAAGVVLEFFRTGGSGGAGISGF